MCFIQVVFPNVETTKFHQEKNEGEILEDSECGLLCPCELWLGCRGSWLPWVPERSTDVARGPHGGMAAGGAQGGLVCLGAPQEQAGAQLRGRGLGERAEALNSRSGCHPIGTTKLEPQDQHGSHVWWEGLGCPPHDSAAQTAWCSGQRGAWGGGSPDFTPPSPGGDAAPLPRATGLTAAPSTSRTSSSTSTGWSSESVPVWAW